MNARKLDEAIDRAVRSLKGSPRDKDTLECLKVFIQKECIGLDSASGSAVLVLMIATIKEGRMSWMHRSDVGDIKGDLDATDKGLDIDKIKNLD